MSQVRQHAWALSLLSTLLLLPALSFAQPEEANGIKVGEGRLHPYFGLELHYDSAAGFFGPNSAIGGELVAHIIPGLRFVLPGSRFDLTLDGKLDYVKYTGWLSSGSQNISRLQALVDLMTALNRDGPVEFDFDDHFARSDATSNVAVGLGVVSIFNEAKALLPWRPGGRALEITPGIAYNVELFQSITGFGAPAACNGPVCDPNQVSAMNYQTVKPSAEGKWKFLPKTAVLLDVGLDVRSYINGGTNPSAQLLRVSTGLTGLVSTKIATVLMVGYSQDFSTSNVKTVIGQAEVSYLVSDTTSLKVGGLRETQPVPIYGTYTDTRAYADGRILLAGKLTLHNHDAYDYLSFYTNSGRHDHIVTVDLGPEYQFASWLTSSAGYVLTVRGSNLAIGSINYTRHEVYLRVTLTY